jgi:pilus assembly protein Flp/PilA
MFHAGKNLTMTVDEGRIYCYVYDEGASCVKMRTCPTASGVSEMKNVVIRFVADESGASAIEYALLAALIAVAIIGAATTVGKNIGNTMNNISNKL